MTADNGSAEAEIRELEDHRYSAEVDEDFDTLESLLSGTPPSSWVK